LVVIVVCVGSDRLYFGAFGRNVASVAVKMFFFHILLTLSRNLSNVVLSVQSAKIYIITLFNTKSSFLSTLTDRTMLVRQ
jgi:hypothetical protein